LPFSPFFRRTFLFLPNRAKRPAEELNKISEDLFCLDNLAELVSVLYFEALEQKQKQQP